MMCNLVYELMTNEQLDHEEQSIYWFLHSGNVSKDSLMECRKNLRAINKEILKRRE